MPVRPEDFDASPGPPGPPNGLGSQRTTDTNTAAEQERARSQLAQQERARRDALVRPLDNGREPRRLPAYVIALILVAALLGAGVILLPSLRSNWRMDPPIHSAPVRVQPSQPHKQPQQEPFQASNSTPLHAPQAVIPKGDDVTPYPETPMPSPPVNPPTSSGTAGTARSHQATALSPAGATAALGPTASPPRAATPTVPPPTVSLPPPQQVGPASGAEQVSNNSADPKLVQRPAPVRSGGATTGQVEQLKPPPREEAPSPTHVAPTYTGPSSGVFTWQGEVRGTALVVIDKGGANFGNVSGALLPGVLCMVQISDPKHFSMAVAPAPSNQWQKVVLNVHGNGMMTVKLNWALP